MRRGEDWKHPRGEHTFVVVYSEMLVQVCRDYPGIPDPRTLKAHEVRFFYEWLREELKRGSAPKA